ncbi:hypothetical protein BpHYR1_048075, partial [Brachionus plicatilis]
MHICFLNFTQAQNQSRLGRPCSKVGRLGRVGTPKLPLAGRPAGSLALPTFLGELSVSYSKNAPFVYIGALLSLWAGFKVWNIGQLINIKKNAVLFGKLGSPIDDCLVKAPIGDATNLNKHLSKHKLSQEQTRSHPKLYFLSKIYGLPKK